MRRLLLAALALAVAASGGAMAQASIVVDARTPRYAPARPRDAPLEGRLPGAEDVSMPWVHGGPPGVAARINDTIYLSVLLAIAPRTPGSSFAAPPDSQLQYFCDIEFRVDRNDGRVLSIRMPMESLGAHCSNATQVFHFDAATGRQLDVTELFTPEGLATLIERRNDAATAAFEQALAALPPDPDARADEDTQAEPDAASAASAADAEDPDHPADEQRVFFKSCISYWSSLFARLPLEIALPATGGVELDVPMCAGDNRHMRVVDPTPDAVPIPAAQLEPLLSPYGRRLLLGQGSAPAPAGLFGQTLHGQVGTLPVTLHLGRPSGDKHEVRAEYAYDRLGTAIMTFGNVQGDTIELWADGAKAFTLRQAGSALVGTWHGKGKSLPVRLE